MNVSFCFGNERLAFLRLLGHLEPVSDTAYDRVLDVERLPEILESGNQNQQSPDKLTLVISAVEFDHDMHTLWNCEQG